MVLQPVGFLAQDRLHYAAVHIRQPECAALKLIRELRVVDPQAVQDRRMQVMHVHRILDDVVAVVVRLAVRDARLDAAATTIRAASPCGWWSRP